MRRRRLALLLGPLLAVALQGLPPGQAQEGPPALPRAPAAPVASPTAAALATPAAAAVTTAAPRAARVGHERAALELRGMALPMHSADPEHDYGPALAELPALGVTDVALFVHMYQPDVASPAPARHPLRTPSDRAIRRAIEQARALGLEVTVVVSVLLERPNGDWRGNLHPRSWDRWFAGYGRELLHWARLAEDAGASTLCVGSELSSSETQVDAWRGLIRAVRAEFSGALTYSANWDHYDQVPFWDALDYIGLSGYYELTSHDAVDPPLDLLREAWARQRRVLTAWRARRGLRAPLLFLEIGYPSKRGCAGAPWDYMRDAPVDVQAQADCYRAFAEAWAGAPELAGTFFYEWWGDGGPADGTYTPRGKPAEDVVRAFFGRAR
jgi:hypothetical protein